MNTRNLISIVAGVAVLGSAVSANATGLDTSLPKPLRVDIGGLFPTDSFVKNNLSKSGLYGGISYDLYSSDVKQGGTPVIGGVYADASYLSGSGFHLTTIGLGVQGRVNVVPNASFGNVYVGAGVGAYFTNANNGLTPSTNNTRLGGKLFAGVEITQGIFIEASYRLIANVDTLHQNGFTAVIGYRF